MKNIINKMMITCALPYANGSIHIGHMLEHIQADIWVRYQRLRGNQVWFFCADDTHGTPIMIKAKQLGIKPEVMIAHILEEHKKDFLDFNISYDNYHSTHSKENSTFSKLIYNILNKNGFIKQSVISQLYDIQEKMFLPDRFVKGTCPKCYTLEQYGDNCEVCGATYNSTELINPKSIISETTPIIKDSEHLFFDLPAFSEKLYRWIHSGTLQDQILNKVKEWFALGLKKWNISRDEPYFGFKIPDKTNKYFYVWLDAPIGYISSFKNLCNKNKNISFNEFWNKDSDTKLYHFIGKDIIYFHSLFWPALLEGSGFRKPNNIFVHGYLTINGIKMSKSRGTFITAKTWLKHLDSDSLRYYFASKLSTNIDDIDLNLNDFVNRINSDIVNKLVNLASRSASFINKYFNNQLSSTLNDFVLYDQFIDGSQSIAKLWECREYSKAITKIMEFTNLANRYIDQKTPWNLVKNHSQHANLQEICSMGINLFRIIMIWISPVLPVLSKRVELFLRSELIWNNIKKPLLNHKIRQFECLYNRISSTSIDDLIKESSQNLI